MTDSSARGRVALVTGASKGLGAAIATRLGQDGFVVAVNYFKDANGAAAVVDAIANSGGRAMAFQADVTDENDVSKLIDDIEEQLGPVDVLVLNATGPQPSHEVEELDWQIMLNQLDYFVKSLVLLVTQLVRGTKERRYGRIINVGSEVVDLAPVGMSAYTAAKCAQLGLARTWARELGPFNINVNTVAPGWILVERHAEVSDGELANYEATVPLGRMGQPSDIANAVSFLASDGAGFLAGTKISVNGGVTVDAQVERIAQYESSRNVPVHYLLYNPATLPWAQSHPLPAKVHLPSNNDLGCRVVDSSSIRNALSTLADGASPSYDKIHSALSATYPQPLAQAGWRLEDFIERVVTCKEGYRADSRHDDGLEYVFNRRSGPIAAAIGVTITAPEDE